MQNRNQKLQDSPHSHKYAVHFDILPEISYLNAELVLLIADFLPTFRGFPENVQIAEKWVDEGLDFCRVIFWVSAESPDAIKSFANWFQAIFREAAIAEVLERLVACALDEPHDIEVILSDWTRLAN
ncbi:MAG: hypothetical protein OXN25_11730 [Candidatus Poribacteria bacterium]|nr:hypothetical protein [Candidatus Poribacteria bacterium]MYK16783.1 hypothetical protein [Candidatus Poribacteria bacterium]